MGVKGETWCGKVTESLEGGEGLVGEDFMEYEDIAVKLYEDREFFCMQRERILEKWVTAEVWVKELEEHLLRIWKEYEDQ